MFLSQDEFNAIMKKNPSLKIHGNVKANGKSEFASVPTQKNEFNSTLQVLKDEVEGTKKSSRKYGNIKVYVYDDGYESGERNEVGHGNIKEVFDSRKEYARYLQLLNMQEDGIISGLKRQTKLVIQPAFIYHGKKIRAITYNADFEYDIPLKESGELLHVIEDVKAKTKQSKKKKLKTNKVEPERFLTTEAFNLKWKLLKARYPEYDFRLF